MLGLQRDGQEHLPTMWPADRICEKGMDGWLPQERRCLRLGDVGLRTLWPEAKTRLGRCIAKNVLGNHLQYLWAENHIYNDTLYGRLLLNWRCVWLGEVCERALWSWSEANPRLGTDAQLEFPVKCCAVYISGELRGLRLDILTGEILAPPGKSVGSDPKQLESVPLRKILHDLWFLRCSTRV